MSLDLFLSGLLQGLILACVAYGVMIPFRLLNFSDLSAEGAYPLGGAVSTALMLSHFPSVVAISLAGLASGIVGLGTAWIHLRLKVNSLLAGIIMSIMMYSVNLRLLGKPNVALFGQVTLFQHEVLLNCLVAIGVILLLLLPLIFFMYTELGLKFRVVGLNPTCASRQAISVPLFTLCGLFIAGCFNGISGALMVQLQQYMDVGMGVGIVIHALASLMLGEVLVGQKTLKQQLFAPLLGALIYQQIQGVILNLGLAPSDLKCFTGLLVLSIIGLQQRKLAYA